MNVTEDVAAGSHTLHRREQILTAFVTPVLGAVENSSRRPVGHEHIGIVRDEIPLLTQRRTALQIEGPVVKPR